MTVLISGGAGALWYLQMKENSTFEFHEQKAHIRGGGRWTDLLFSLRDGVYMTLGRDRVAVTDDELLYLAFIGPVGAMFYAVVYARLTIIISRSSVLSRKQDENMALVRGSIKSLGLPP